MSTTRILSAVFDATPEKLLAVLTDADFLVAQQKLDPATTDAHVDEILRTDAKLVLKLHATQYARGMRGIDRSRTEPAVTTYTWDLAARSAQWAYHGAYSERFSAAGADRIEHAADGARLTTEFYLTVRVPVIGRQIEKFVVKQFDARQPKYEQVVRDFCVKLG